MVAGEEVAARADAPATFAEAIAQLLEHGAFRVETTIGDTTAPVLRTVVYLDGDASTHVASRWVGTPELERALVVHGKALNETIAKLGVFARSFDRVGLALQAVVAFVPAILDALVEHDMHHAGILLVGSITFVVARALIMGANGRRLARRAADAVCAIRFPSKKK